MQSPEQTPDTGAAGDAISEGGSRTWMNNDFASFVTSPPLLAVTISAPTYRPGTGYRRDARAPVAVELSRQFLEQDNAAPSPSLTCPVRLHESSLSAESQDAEAESTVGAWVCGLE